MLPDDRRSIQARALQYQPTCITDPSSASSHINVTHEHHPYIDMEVAGVDSRHPNV